METDDDTVIALEQPRRTTNTEFITELMEFARTGPLMQAFVIESIRRYAQTCAQAHPDTFDSGVMNGRAWVACAKEARDQIDKRLNGASA